MTRAFRTPPVIEAPPTVTGLAVALIVAHAVRVFSPVAWQGFILSAGSLQPDRFWAWAGLGAPGAVAYDSPVSALLPFLTEALLHDGWGGAILNAALVVILGRPVYFSLSIGRRNAAWPFLAVFAASEEGRNGRILSNRFLTVFVAFAAINLLLWFLGPAILGARISWQAHIGGFLAGALAFQAFRASRRIPRI